MCGIVAYIGDKEACPILLKGLQRLEYRGYDSAGVAIMNSDLHVYKIAGKVKTLVDFIKDKPTHGSIGIGHTRWATHGEPNNENAHPHLSENNDIALIHNGIIENYDVLKVELQNRGHHFRSDTDTEVLVHLIEDIMKNENLSLDESVRYALNRVEGAYAIVVLSKTDPNMLVAARKGSPLVIGIGEGEYFLASDATPIVEYTRNVIYMNDDNMAIIKRDSFSLKTIENKIQTPYIQELEMNLETLEKGGYEHFMLKEIHEQPNSIRDTFRGRLSIEKGEIRLGGIQDYINKLDHVKRVVITACGTSWHAALIGEYLIEELARIPVEVEYGSEFRYRNPVIFEDDLLIAISQSGETADTLAAIELAKKKIPAVFGICNVVGSTIARTTNAGVYTHAGPEIGVASTKAFTSQLVVLTLLALQWAKLKGTISNTRYHEYIHEFNTIPDKVAEVMKTNDRVKEIAAVFKDAKNFLYLGRGLNFPVALEGALKLKEISYIHAEGYPAAEMKHGPIALIDENMPVVVIATNKNIYDKVLSNIQEVKARKGVIIAVVNKGDKVISEVADYVIEIPETDEIFSPMISVVPLQLLAYHIAVMRGCHVDQPRNLAKSVTVE
ncbi:MAG: glutamine--fructose-6-phosphate transaminase (isomerizing) [Bacteroidetes bacterium]|jgi:glutamine---fructose-6-phosphate transaminase (isomerizing)|nr:glutamine--fructose-6-phosphate transaminase (isomerizing) [Bacteroidota bacterium]MBT3800217.1 glutamine--fructose-6-phosphate transaminase (isomerizing) [Bacteroidota bacterium]MBT3934310.1 glutamine--fructose-6-phosphate transaminase (isomerizing) [Bacteroidota bacterium]MBT4337190.1 glutamine--fructose-6-phosphate transaminase (isomerizing) [Bacteroidota bacterium]MBT4727580.1 glutamine--fructose-6-phosphate transaminase (isomerizing) [Bacteroidota bacterium]